MDALEELCERPQWLCWRSDPPLVEGGKRRKVPVSPRTGRNASSTDAATWGTAEQALAWRDEHPDTAGVGFVFTPDDPYSGIDLDACIDAATGVLAIWARAIVDRLDSYTEVSPSGTGVHTIVRAIVPAGGNRRGSVELYDRARYFTITGVALDGTPATIANAQPALDAIHRSIFQTDDCVIQPISRSYAGTVDADDGALLQRMFAAPNGAEIQRLWAGDARRYADAEHPQGNASSADMALCAHLTFWTGGDQARADRLFRSSGLWRSKWDERRGSQSYGQRTLSRVSGRATLVRGAIAL